MRWPVVVVVLLAGCGGSAGDGFESPHKEGQYHLIHLTAERTFEPAKALVPEGALVSFVFDLPCDVRSEAPGPDSTKGSRYGNGYYPAGERYNWIAVAGEHHVACTKHAGMAGVVRVA